MPASLSTSTSNVYNIMNSPSQPMKNLDSQKAMSIGSELQQNIQEVQMSREKGTNETFKREAYKINLLV